MPPSAAWVLHLALATITFGCVEAGVDVRWESSDGPAVAAVVQGDQITHWYPLDPSEPSLSSPVGPEGRVFVITASRRRVAERHDAIDGERVEALAFAVAPSELLECPDGVLTEDGEIVTMDYALASLVEVRELRGSTLELIDGWPTALDQLSLRVPAQRCRTLPARVAPFADRSPILEENDYLGSIEISSANLDETSIEQVFHAGLDLALLRLDSALVLLERGEAMSEAEVIDFNAPGQPLPGLPNAHHLLLHVARRPWSDPSTEPVFVLVIGHGAYETFEDLGVSIIEMPISNRRFGTPRVLHYEDTGRESAGAISIGDSDDFLLSLGDRALYRRGTEEIRLTPPSGSEVTDLVLSEVAEPGLVLGLNRPGWIEASLAAPERITSVPAPRGDPLYDRCSELFAHEVGPTRRLHAGCSHPAIFERRPEGWIERPIWFSSELTECSATVRRCGRAQANFRFEVAEMTSAPGDRLAYLLRGCRALILSPLEGDGCAQHVLIEVERFRNHESEIRLRTLDRVGDRLLVAGEGGLLVEVELE